MPKLVRFLMIAPLAASWLFGATGIASATTSAVDCGQVMAYTAPDPLAPTDGSLTIGLLPAWVIAADAILSPSVAANLASVAGTGPSCFAMDRDGSDVITALDFAAQGTVEGATVFDAGLPGYIFADRLLVPSFITDTYPGLALIFPNSAVTGTTARTTFFVDTSTGRFTGFEATGHFCGPLDLAGNGDGTVGAATIAADLLDAKDRAVLAKANGAQGCADVASQGTIDGGGSLTIASQVVITRAVSPTPPATSTLAPVATTGRPEPGPFGLALGLLLACLIGTRTRRDRAGR